MSNPVAEIVFIGDNLHEMSNPVSWEKYEKYNYFYSILQITVMLEIIWSLQWWLKPRIEDKPVI